MLNTELTDVIEFSLLSAFLHSIRPTQLPLTDEWALIHPSHLHIQFTVSQLFCKPLSGAKSQLMGAGPDMDPGLLDDLSWGGTINLFFYLTDIVDDELEDGGRSL